MAEETNETWFSTTWRPAMAWQYWLVCLFDFIVFPILNGWYFTNDRAHFQDWHPLTLQGGGLYHLSMGAILGVTSWQRSQEKMTAIKAGGGSYTESSTTQTVVSKDTPPPKVDIKTDTVQIKNSDAGSSRAD